MKLFKVRIRTQVESVYTGYAETFEEIEDRIDSLDGLTLLRTEPVEEDGSMEYNIDEVEL